MIREFVKSYSTIYGSQFINYNVHSLIHLPFSVRLYGPLDNFSVFKCENYLQIFKKSMKCCKYPLSEIKNKIISLECEELKTITLNKCILKYFKIDENLSNFELTFYHQITPKSNNYVICYKNIKNQSLF